MTTTMKAPAAMPAIFDPAYEPLAVELLKDYFKAPRDKPDGERWFTGAHFETLAGQWDAPESANVVTPGDLAAVTCLSVKVPGRAAVRILESQSAAITSLLKEMPGTQVPLWEVPEETIVGPDSAVSRLWHLLRKSKDGMGHTTTSKLMARKRANLVPIYDSVIGSVLGLDGAKGHWATMRSLMLSEVQGQPLHQRLATTAAQAEVDPVVTPLRVFDVIVWYAYNPASKTRARAQKIAHQLLADGSLTRPWTVD